jgi:vacuolar-type H+-ATPase subunit E/Vma4
MKKANLSCKLLLSSLALTLFLAATPQPVSAAEDAFINEIEKQYSDFEKKHKDIYDAYLKNERHLYNTYKQQMESVFNELEKLAFEDLELLTSTMDKDIQQLKKKYKSNNSALREYIRSSNKDLIGAPMYQYKYQMSAGYIGSPMDNFETHLDAGYIGRAMDQYDNTLSPGYIGSALDSYENAVNAGYIGGIMDGIDNQSSTGYVGSIMDSYDNGHSTKEEASKKMAAAFTEAEEDMNNKINETMESVQSQKNSSLQSIRDAWLNAKNSILKQREVAISEASDARKELTGTGIEFDPLVLNNWITVIIDGDYLIFEQPPVSSKGYTLVPMRAVFEKLGAEVLWNASDQSVTANKGATKIWLQLDNSTAKVNGQDQTLEVAPTKINNSTMVPLRFVSEALGAKVEWDSSKQTITITSAP